MDVKTFIGNYRSAFGPTEELPIVFWYSDIPVNPVEKIGGCLFKYMQDVRKGIVVSLNAATIGCGGGKFYTGFSEMPERIPAFVSGKEKYKQTPEMVKNFIDNLKVQRTEKEYLNFARIDQRENFQNVEGIFFLCRPDILSGLITWTHFDNNLPDAVSVPFGSGCSVVLTETIRENRKNGERTFLGFFDLSVRPYFDPDILCYAIPLSRFEKMYNTMKDSALFNTHAWEKIKGRNTPPVE